MATSSRRPVQPRLSTTYGQSPDLLSMFSDFAFSAANTAGKITAKGVDIVNSTVDAVGLKDKVEAAESMARKLAAKGKSDANKAVNKARRMASRAFDFDEEEEGLASYDYHLLLSLAGAVERKIAGYSSLSFSFTVPAGSAMVWKARVKKMDIGFSVRELREPEAPFIIEPLQRFGAEQQIQGEVTPVSNRTRVLQLVFDNVHSALQRKTVVYWVGIGEKVSLKDDHSSSGRNKEVMAAEEGPPDYSSPSFSEY